MANIINPNLKVTYDDKQDGIDLPSLPEVEKVIAANVNELKNVINNAVENIKLVNAESSQNKADIDQIDSSIMAFKNAGKDAGRKVLEILKK